MVSEGVVEVSKESAVVLELYFIVKAYELALAMILGVGVVKRVVDLIG
jgi:hypothetical protein|tara:strand:- start:36 stop:179 length:144 start_codon:yes stop_codon:yes gene_type:complete